MIRRAPGRSTGIGLIELLIALVIFVLIGAKITMIVRTTLDYAGEETATLALESQAERVLDQIAYALVGADRQTLMPEGSAPIYTSSVNYRISLGVEDGEIVWTAPEAIGLASDNDAQIVWQENSGQLDERSVVWTNLARPFLEGEVLNGIDDNGNGLIDEKGLSFDVGADTIIVRLSLGVVDGDSVMATRTLQANVTCRNTSGEQ